MSLITLPKAHPMQVFVSSANRFDSRNLLCGAALATAIQCVYASPQQTRYALPATHASISVANIAAKSNSILVFVDSRVPDSDQLLMNAANGTDIIYLNQEEDGLHQIARALAQRSDIQSIQIISHGEAGQLQLGNGFVSSKNLKAYANALHTIKQSLAAGGDILLFGCDVGAGAVGQSFVNQLALATGAGVAASTNKTGSVKNGGDWELEIVTGEVKSTPVMNLAAMNDYESTLHTASVNSVAQLKTAIATGASDGSADTITLTGNITFASAADAITINVTDGQTMSIVGNGFILSGNNHARVLDVTAGSVNINDLTISNGFLTGAGGNTPGNGSGLAGGDALGANIRNAGTLTISNSTITAGKAAGGGGGGGGAANGGGAGGGGGGFGSTFGGTGGTNNGGATHSPGAASAGTGGDGAGFGNLVGRGGTTSGGAGANYGSGYTNGGTGGTANNGSISIGGGGGGGGYHYAGGRGGNAAGGIYNTGILTITTSSITNNIAAGGGGGGGGAAGISGNGGDAGSGIGAIWNAGGTVQIDSTTNTSLATGNVGVAGGVGSTLNGGSSNGAAGTSTSQIRTTSGGTTNTSYAPAPTVNIGLSDSALSVGETSSVTFTFSAAVTGFTNADLTIPNGSMSAVSSGDGGITWTSTYTPNSSVQDTTNLIAIDMTGVSSSGTPGVGTTNSANFTIDTLRPTATIVVTDNNLLAGETSLVTFTFSEAVTGFTNADLTIANGTLSAVSSGDGGITWTATFTPTASVSDATNLITLDNTGVTDAAGNAGSGTTDSNNYAINTVRPTASIVVTDNSLLVGETSLVTITFSEAVTGFTNADLSIANGTLSSVSSGDGGVTWTATLTPTASVTDATNIITLANTGVANTAGNAGTGTTNSNNYAIDTARPTASIVVADTALAVGETSLVTITFSEVVTGFTNADLTIDNGTLSAVSTGDGGTTWTGTFTPTASITDAANLITLDNTGVTDVAGNAGTGTTDSNNYAIDSVRPTASLVVSDSALLAGETSLVTITFNEAVTGFTNADLTIANGTLSAVSSGDGGITWTATLTPTASISDATNLITLDNTGLTDTAGNAGTGATDSNNYTIDTVRPTAAIVVADTALAAGETSLVTVTFSEVVTGFTNADLTIANGTLSAVSSGDGGITWTATFTPTASITDATNVITLANMGVSDAAGNTGTGTTDSNNYAIDTARPTASIVVADTALAIGETSLVTITFSEAVTGFTNADLTIANGTLSAVSSGDGGITWTATLTPTASITDATNVITLDNTGITDASGNAGTGTTDSNNYAIDSTRPTASLVVADTALAAGETSLVTITLSESVTGFTNADLTIANGTLSAVSSGDGGITWTATLTPTASITDATNIITLANTGVADSAGNAGTGTTDSNNYAIDTSRPTASIVVADTTLAAGETSLVTITFSEAVSGFANADLTIANGTLSAVSSGDGGITWTATFTPTASVVDATNVITLANTGVADAGGNTGTGTTDSNNYAIDTARPTASIVVATTALIEGDTSAVTITFSEAVTGFTNADLTIENATLSTVSSGDGGITWTATLTAAVGVNDSSNVITLNNTGVADAAGNTGTGTTNSNNYTVNMANSSPILSGLNGGSTYIENGTAVVIDADVSVSDADFDLLNSGNGNYSGASIVIARSGGAVSSDIIGFNNGNGISQIGNSLIKNGLAIANINSSVQGQWTISFTDANTEIPTRNDALAVLRQLTYSSSNDDPATSVNLGLVLSDGIVTTPGVASVTITPVNDAPTLTATAASPTFTEGGSAVNFFSGSAVSTVEAGQLITELQLTVTNLVNGANEIITIDGSNLALTNGNSATTATNSMTANVSVSGSTATLVLTKPVGISTAAAQSLVNDVSYRNTSEAVTNSIRAVTLTRVVDDGGTANSGVDTATISVTSTLVLAAINDGPAISGTPAASVNQDAAYAFVPVASDLDGDTLVFSILNKPTWASFNTATGALTGTPLNADVGVTNGVVISVSDGTSSLSLPGFNLTVVNLNDAPTISGTPAITVDEDSAYSFTPTANDVDAGTTLVYSITNRPSWASFSTTTGSLTGTPTNADVGVTNGVVISVSDGTASASLTGFNLTVANTNDAPTISGTPTTSIDQDVAYSFAPTAGDVDLGTTLTYSITNKPAWASFNTATGALSGVPAFADAGVYSGIVIGVSDGQLSAALPAFSITVIQGQNPDEPVLTAPAGITLNATALYTPVSVRQLLGLAANSTQAQVDAALDALASNVSGNNCCTTAPQGLNASNALLLAPGRHEVRWVARNTSGLTDEDVQIVNIKPLVNFSKPQLAIRNSQTEFRILLNGRSPVYPFEVAYRIDNSTTAATNEHSLVAGIAQFTVDNPLEAVIPVTINPLTGIGNRELVVSFSDSQLNAGAANRHVISIREGNLPPVVSLVLTQGGVETSQITPNGGAVTASVQVDDFNATDTHSFDWSATQGLSDTDGNATNANRVFSPTGLTGVHQVVVRVTDSAGASVQAELSFRVVASLPVLTVNEDADDDGISDSDEGIRDSDGNGIPNYLDNMPSSNVLPQVGLITDSYLIECDPGVRCGLGLLALGGNSGGVQILDNEVGNLGNLVKDNKFVPSGGIFDFVIKDLPTAGQTVRVVVPQQAPIPANAVYRKFQNGKWVNFVEDADNTLHSAAGNPGYCPPPGSSAWQPGLTAGHLCVQLGIEDGGPNDDDGLVNAAVSDPGAVSAPEAVVEIKTKGKGGGSVNGLFLLILAAILFLPIRKLKAGLLLVMGLVGISSNTQALDWGSVTDKISLRLDIYEAQSKAEQSYLQSDIDAAGFDAQVTYFEVEERAYAFSVAYQWSPLTYTQLGYLDLGDVEVNLVLDAAEDRNAFSRALENSYPITADGLTLVQGLSMYPHPKVHLSTEAGVFVWDGKINVDGDQLDLDYDNQADLLVGFRLDYELISHVSLGVSLKHIAFDHQGLDLFGVSARYGF